MKWFLNVWIKRSAEFFFGGGAEQVGSFCLLQSWIFARLLGTSCRGSAFLVLARVRRGGCGLPCNFLGALGHCDSSWVRHGFCWSRGRRRPWCIWTRGWMWRGIGRSDRCKFFLKNRLLVKKHCVCELDFYSAFHLVPWDVLTAFLCRIAECALLLLLRIFEGIFGRVVWWVLAMWRGSCFLLWISVWMCTGSTARDGERWIDRLFIWSRIDCRQNDAQEFLLPSYFHFVRVLEVPCTEMFDCCVFRAWCVCLSFCWCF